MIVHPAKTQLSLGIRPVWSESSLSAWRKLGSLETHWAHSKDSDQPGHPAHTHIVGFVMSWLICNPNASGSYCVPPYSSHGLCRKCSEVSDRMYYKGLLDPSFKFCCQVQALTSTKEGWSDERPHQLNIRSKRDVLVPPYGLHSRKSCCCRGNPLKNLLDPSFRSLKFATAPSR